MASAPCAAITSHAAPPTEVESTQRGCTPRYSPTSMGAMVPVEVEPSPSMSAGVRPASCRARLLACAIRPYAVLDGVLPTSDSATPATATRRFRLHLQFVGPPHADPSYQPSAGRCPPAGPRFPSGPPP